MFTPISDELYQDSAAHAVEHPACELFPASRSTGRLFGFGVALGFVGLLLDGFGAGFWAWLPIGLAALVLLLAGSRVVRS